MDPTDAAANIRAAIAGRVPRSYAEVSAGDVVAVGSAVPADKKNATTEALVAGATNALAGRGNPDLKVHQLTYQLADLLERSGL